MSQQIEQLNAQFQDLVTRINQSPLEKQDWFNKNDLFHSSCFYCQSDDINDYLSELKSNISKLSNLTDNDYLSFLSEKVTEQFSCFRNLLNSLSISKKAKQYKHSHQKRLAQVKQLNRKVNHSSQELYTELSKLQEFERRLLDMVDEKQRQLSTYSGNKFKNDYQQQVLVTQQRLGRCRQAISKVEEQIQNLDRQSQGKF